MTNTSCGREKTAEKSRNEICAPAPRKRTVFAEQALFIYRVRIPQDAIFFTVQNIFVFSTAVIFFYISFFKFFCHILSHILQKRRFYRTVVSQILYRDPENGMFSADNLHTFNGGKASDLTLRR